MIYQLRPRPGRPWSIELALLIDQLRAELRPADVLTLAETLTRKDTTP